MATVAFEGVATPADASRNPYLYLRFQVPAGTTRIDVRYSYDRGNYIDIGIFDPSVLPFPSHSGFRGWSGSDRSTFFVATDDATLGYLAGEIPAGEWRVILGLYGVRREQCRYLVEIDLDDSPRPLIAPAVSPVDAPERAPVDPSGSSPVDGRESSPVDGPERRAQAGWYKGDLHTHSRHSDAKGSLEDLISASEAAGLDFLAVTDHNTVSHHPFLSDARPSGILLVAGEEVSASRGHANVWGVRGWVDFRLAHDTDVERLVDEVHQRGGVVSVNHPKDTGRNWEYRIPEGFDCFEAWQLPWPCRNWQSLERYDALLREGRKLTLVGGSDRHQPASPPTEPDPELLRPGVPTTWLFLAELTVAAVLKTLREGRAFVSEEPEGPRLEFTLNGASMGETVVAVSGQPLAVRVNIVGGAGSRLRYVGAGGAVREVSIPDDDTTDQWDWLPDGPFLRAEVVADAESGPETGFDLEALKALRKVPASLTLEEVRAHSRVRALSNPVYVDLTSSRERP